jgi:hypothetical protein
MNLEEIRWSVDGFHKMWGVLRLAEELLASEGLAAWTYVDR